MSIPDNPFGGIARTSTPPILNVETDLTPPGRRSNNDPNTGGSTPPSSSEPTNSQPLSTAHTPGGSLLVPMNGTGSRPPRRVQWKQADSLPADSHVISMQPLGDGDDGNGDGIGSPVSQLDESNISQVHAALERHRTAARRARPPSMLSEVSTIASAPERSSEDYDYRLDTGVPPPTAPIEPVTSGESGRFRDEGEQLSAMLDHGLNRHVSEYIAPGETDGLPSISQNENGEDLDAAKELVRAHTGKWGVLRRRVKGAGAVGRAFTPRSENPPDLREKSEGRSTGREERRRRDDEDDDEDDGLRQNRTAGHLHAGAGGMPPIPGGASVLSSLLALYGQQPNDGTRSGSTSAASSRPTSEDEDDSDEERRRKAQGSGGKTSFFGRSGRKASADTDSTPGEVIIHDEPRPAHLASDSPTPIAHQRSQSTGSLPDHPHGAAPPNGLFNFFKKAKRDIQESDRPKAARNGAGVFGALIQNTASISGVATPAASTLAPAAKRPGYQLSRYSLPDADAPDLRAPWRPSSRPSSRSASRPASIHSSTAVSNNGDSAGKEKEAAGASSSSYALEKSVSVDTEVPRPDFKKRNKSALTLDSLGRLPGAALKESGHALKNAEKWIMSGGKTPLVTPPGERMGDGYFGSYKPLSEDEKRRKQWEAEKKRRKKAREARKKQEIFIIQHVAAILARQQFLLKLARALMMFGSPSHRLETQIQATAKVLELNAQVVYIPGTMLISFGDDATHTSETKFLKQATGLDLGKLLATHNLYWNVVHDKMSVDVASKDLDMLMTTPVYYNWWQTLIVGGACSAFIVIIGFSGSFLDALVSIPLGMLLVGVQMLSARNDMFSNVFEIAIATVISVIAAALGSTGHFCYTAVVSGGVVLILPGYIVLCGALELASRNITAGAVRIGYSVIYSLFLGFGVSIGAEIYRKIANEDVLNADDYTCANTHYAGAPWYQVTPSQYWYFLCCPAYPLVLALRNQQPIFAKELPIMVLIAVAGWCSNHFSAIAFPGRSDMTSAIGSFVVGTLGNIYGRFSNGSSFPVSVVGILFQLPSGLSNGGIFNFAESATEGSSEAYSDGFSVAEQLVSVAIGLTVGLFVSAAVTHPFGGGRRRGAGIFAF